MEDVRNMNVALIVCISLVIAAIITVAMWKLSIAIVDHIHQSVERDVLIDIQRRKAQEITGKHNEF